MIKKYQRKGTSQEKRQEIIDIYIYIYFYISRRKTENYWYSKINYNSIVMEYQKQYFF